jgi:peptide/nickel transport system permease protein
MSVVVKKVALLVVVVIAVTFFTALLSAALPGDPAEVVIPFGSEEQRDQFRQDNDLDDPVPVRYVKWLGRFATGDLGKYYTPSSSDPVSERVSTALPISIQLMVYAQVFALVFAIPLGIWTAQRARSKVDRAVSATAFGLIAIPNFALGLVLAYYVGVVLNWVPPTGYRAFGDDPVEHFRRMILPTISLGLGQVAIYMRLLRSDMIATLQEDFILMARAKGISPRRVLWRHALRPSSLTLLTVAALNVGALIGGAVVIEQVFSIPGIGSEIASAILRRQYVALQSLVAIVAVGYVLINFFIDFLYTVLDPRIRK